MSDDKTIGEELSQEKFLARVRHARLSDAELARRYGGDGRPAPDALPVEAIQQRLETLVYRVLSMRRSAGAAAEALAWFPAARERDQLARALAVITDELGGNLSAPVPEGERPDFRVEREPDDNWPGGFAFQLVPGDQPIQPLPETVQLMHSIVQDFGHIPSEYLEAAGQGLYHRRQGVAAEGEATVEESDTHVYDEGDYGRQGYRRGWCRLR